MSEWPLLARSGRSTGCQHPLSSKRSELMSEWWFEPAKGGIHVKWTYAFHANNRITKFPLALFVNTQGLHG